MMYVCIIITVISVVAVVVIVMMLAFVRWQVEENSWWRPAAALGNK